MRQSSRGLTLLATRGVVTAAVLVAIVVGASGVSCDHEAATVFRQTATGPIGDGVKSILDGILDGVVAAIENAGSGDSDDSSSSSSSTST
jgi:hypothetical protein